MKTTRIFFTLLVVVLSLSTYGLAQSNAHADYSHQHKDAERYQRSLTKQRRKQGRERAKAPKAYRDRHQ